MQPYLASVVTLSTTSIPHSTAVLTLGHGVIPQSTGISTPICTDFYLTEALYSRMSQRSWYTSAKLSADGNPVAVLIMKNLAFVIFD